MAWLGGDLFCLSGLLTLFAAPRPPSSERTCPYRSPPKRSTCSGKAQTARSDPAQPSWWLSPTDSSLAGGRRRRLRVPGLLLLPCYPCTNGSLRQGAMLLGQPHDETCLGLEPTGIAARRPTPYMPVEAPQTAVWTFFDKNNCTDHGYGVIGIAI